MFGWRGKIGYVAPAYWGFYSSEWDRVLPDGVVIVAATLGISALIPEEFKRIIPLYQSATEKLAKEWEVGHVFFGGTPIITYMGYEKATELAKQIQESTGVPTMAELTAHIDALNKLSAKKIVVATPYENERNEERKRLLEELGFEVLSIKGAGKRRPYDIANQPSYASYRLAREAFLEHPEADAIYISCPGWEVVGNIDMLEKDCGKPVVAHIPALLWAALTTMNMKLPIKGYGKLLEML